MKVKVLKMNYNGTVLTSGSKHFWS